MAEYVLIGVPIVTGYVTSFLCPTQKQAGARVAFRPPSAAFAVVWPLLYILLGVAWCFAHRGTQGTDRILVHVFTAALLLCLVGWMVTYSCAKRKKGAVYVLLASVLLSLAVYTVYPSTYMHNMTRLMVLPLVVWLGFATLLNATEIQSTSRAQT